MRITVEFMAFVRRPIGIERIFDQTLNNETTVNQFMENLGFSQSEINMMQYFVSDGSGKEKSSRVQKKYIFKEDDHLFITLPIGGG
ncbi:MAG: hypothetical protein INQ03_18745 [Candidatus Heimdallarchaeota archaeon]|nr:hypothetical protein [Candidatus Heimdallarchaeota archaeon]